MDGTKIEANANRYTLVWGKAVSKHKAKLQERLRTGHTTKPKDRWTCPAGQTLHFRKESKEILESGYEIRKRHYRSQSCEGCPLKESCTKASGNREVVVSLERLRYQKQAREMLQSEEGYLLAVRRMTEPESVFGQLKNNRGFRRFLLRGIEKVTLEVGWLSLAHNLLKQAANDQKRRAAILQ